MKVEVKRIFVFGSNESGIHGAGAARFAILNRGAVQGLGFGYAGDSFAIPTKSWWIRDSLKIANIRFYVDRFIEYAKLIKEYSPEKEFQVTQIGCGHAGFTAEEIAPLFLMAPENCLFDLAWKEVFDPLTKKFNLPEKKYWGTL